MAVQWSAPELADRYSIHVEELRDFFALQQLHFGAAEDIGHLNERLEASESFREDMTSMVRSIILHEGGTIPRANLLEIVAIAIGGRDMDQAGTDVQEPLHKLLSFLISVMRKPWNQPPGEYRMDSGWTHQAEAAGESAGKVIPIRARQPASAPAGEGGGRSYVRSEGIYSRLPSFESEGAAALAPSLEPTPDAREENAPIPVLTAPQVAAPKVAAVAEPLATLPRISAEAEQASQPAAETAVAAEAPPAFPAQAAEENPELGGAPEISVVAAEAQAPVLTQVPAMAAEPEAEVVAEPETAPEQAAMGAPSPVPEPLPPPPPPPLPGEAAPAAAAIAPPAAAPFAPAAAAAFVPAAAAVVKPAARPPQPAAAMVRPPSALDPEPPSPSYHGAMHLPSVSLARGNLPASTRRIAVLSAAGAAVFVAAVILLSRVHTTDAGQVAQQEPAVLSPTNSAGGPAATVPAPPEVVGASATTAGAGTSVSIPGAAAAAAAAAAVTPAKPSAYGPEVTQPAGRGSRPSARYDDYIAKPYATPVPGQTASPAASQTNATPAAAPIVRASPADAAQPGTAMQTAYVPPQPMARSLIRPADPDATYVRASDDSIPLPRRPASIASAVMAANLMSAPAPGYPMLAKVAHIEGPVVVRAEVGRDGNVIDVSVVSGHRLLRGAAVDAVRRWRFRPYVVDGHPAPVFTTITLHFPSHR